LSGGNTRRAAIADLTKKEAMPRPTPNSFLKDSLRRSRNAMTADMSTSLKVVSIAAVCCASTSRRAMVWRRLVMRTRSSVRDPGAMALVGVILGGIVGATFDALAGATVLVAGAIELRVGALAPSVGATLSRVGAGGSIAFLTS